LSVYLKKNKLKESLLFLFTQSARASGARVGPSVGFSTGGGTNPVQL